MKISSTIKNLLLIIIISACASKPASNSTASLTSKNEFELRDKSGTFRLKRESGSISKDKRIYAVKQIITDNSQKTLERSIVMSKVGSLKGKISILRPEKSEYTVWFDGKEYSSRIEINEKIRGLIVQMDSPEQQWRGEKQFKFPEGTGAYCFFSQVIECATVMGFINKAIAAGGGAMNLHIVWEGYPYFQQQYIGIPESLFTQATLTYDGESENGLRRFSLSIAGSSQVIFYQLNKSNILQAIYWPAQGLSIGAKGSAE